jgi:hypothetical protein
MKNNMNNEINYKLIAERLWGILDDIDCSVDHYKPALDDKFVNYVSEKIKERGWYANSLDGQTLTFEKDIPIIDNLDPMCKWFKDAWRIEKDPKNNKDIVIPLLDPETGGIEIINSTETKQTEDDAEVKLHNTTDAQVWTDEFLKLLPKLFFDVNACVKKDRYDDFEEWVFGWFCNAIQTGIDLTNNERNKQYIYILQSNGEGIVDIYYYEPRECDMNSSYRAYLQMATQPDASIDCTLYRYSKYNGLQSWNGKVEKDTNYNWKNAQ